MFTLPEVAKPIAERPVRVSSHVPVWRRTPTRTLSLSVPTVAYTSKSLSVEPEVATRCPGNLLKVAQVTYRLVVHTCHAGSIILKHILVNNDHWFL